MEPTALRVLLLEHEGKREINSAQAAGHPLATPRKVAPHWNSRCEHAWTQRYRTTTFGFSMQQNADLLLPETQRQQQEQDQPAPLPPLSPNRRPSEEEVEDGLDRLYTIVAYA